MTERPIKHGTIYAYTGRGCRCELCREASRLYSLNYRKTPSGSQATRKSASRNNFIRQEALAWVRANYPAVIDELERRWHEQKLASTTEHQ